MLVESFLQQFDEVGHLPRNRCRDRLKSKLELRKHFIDLGQLVPLLVVN